MLVCANSQARDNPESSSSLSKSCDVRDRDWDVYLPYLLFAYRVSAQESTKESPFFGRDARIPTDSVLTHVRSPYAVDVDESY